MIKNIFVPLGLAPVMSQPLGRLMSKFGKALEDDEFTESWPSENNCQLGFFVF
jgi:hypothetical protein